MTDVLDRQLLLLHSLTPHTVITVVGRRGSVPQDIGAKAIVTSAGLYFGTVGGGKVEAFAIAHALEILASTGNLDSEPHVKIINLNRDLGMTCGGEVRLFFESFGIARPWRVAVFGAGHVAQALVRILKEMSCQITCMDERYEWVDKLPTARNLKTIVSSALAEQVRGLADGTQVVILTKGHATDLPVLLECLVQDRFEYIGVIGSQSKASRLRKALRETGMSEVQCQKFNCPIGLPFGQNDPAEIAVSIVGQLLWNRDRARSQLASKWQVSSQGDDSCQV